MKVLMVGPNRGANGGIASVVNEYYKAGLDKLCELEYFPTITTGSLVNKLACFFIAITNMKKAIRRNDIIHIHMSKNGSFYRKALFVKEAKKQHKKIIIHIHSSQFMQFYNTSNKYAKKYIRSILNKADKVIVLSEFWYNTFDEIVSKEKLVVLPNGITRTQYYDKEYDDQNILFLGRLTELKGIYDLMLAFNIVLGAYPHAHLYIGGKGEDDNCKTKCEELDITNRVSFCGWVSGDKKEKLLQQCSIFVLPSYTEGMPVSLLEAMSFGCSCIATNVGGVPDIIEDKVNGLLVRPGKPDELSSAISELLSDIKMKKQLGKKALNKYLNEYDENKIVNKMIELYNEVSEGKNVCRQ